MSAGVERLPLVVGPEGLRRHRRFEDSREQVTTVNLTWLYMSTSWCTMTAPSTGFHRPSTAVLALSRLRTSPSTGKTAAWFSAPTPTTPRRWSCSIIWTTTERRSARSSLMRTRSRAENGEWNICHKPSRKNVKDDLYEDITFYLIIERKPLFYIINIIVPCILTSVLAIFVFYLPPGAGEKMTLSISVLIALTVFMLLLADKVPETSLAIPIIVNYVMFTMILVTFSVILSVVVLNLHHRTPSTHIMPNWVRSFFINFLPKYIGMTRPEPEECLLKEDSSEQTPAPSFNGRQRHGGEYFFRKINPDLVVPWRGRCESLVQLQRLPGTDGFCLILPPDLKSAIAAVTYIAEQLKKQDTDDSMTEDWQFIALVVDRLFLWLFVIITTLGTLAMFLDASFNYTPDDPFP
ncbi:cholinergic receptor, nicotinic, beta 1 (muscle) like isoform X3 [Phyllopteryx taeniolatus]|uniref:cholinergic receptor, nicotinic, beta 1 (muscle) like isoform X3 n=1 Tax=Phyllopteryx taeniolatus TaxID=161469 RepID=UPI002AD403D4|nr:cholinergic receptor, nicotinic, beta 1 (muscle) like isoform X3 [Phyllopteryx taeniolatus]